MARNKIEHALRMKDEASHNIQKVSKEVDALSGSLKRLGAGLISIGTGLEIAKMADKYRLLQNRLRLVTKGTEELGAVTEQLTRISLRSRTSFQSTLDLYARVARSSRTLGKSQQELLDFTETVSKSIRIFLVPQPKKQRLVLFNLVRLLHHPGCQAMSCGQCWNRCLDLLRQSLKAWELELANSVRWARKAHYQPIKFLKH